MSLELLQPRRNQKKPHRYQTLISTSNPASHKVGFHNDWKPGRHAWLTYQLLPYLSMCGSRKYSFFATPPPQRGSLDILKGGGGGHKCQLLTPAVPTPMYCSVPRLNKLFMRQLDRTTEIALNVERNNK